MELLTYTSAVEKAFSEEVTPRLEKALDVHVERLHHDESAGVLHLDLLLPTPTSRDVRHAVLRELQEFELSCFEAVVTSPRFLVSADH